MGITVISRALGASSGKEINSNSDAANGIDDPPVPLVDGPDAPKRQIEPPFPRRGIHTTSRGTLVSSPAWSTLRSFVILRAINFRWTGNRQGTYQWFPDNWEERWEELIEAEAEAEDENENETDKNGETD